MKPEQQIPRNALVWIVLSLFTLMAPHAPRIPIWVMLLYLVAAIWRIMVYRGSWSFPGWRAKLVLIACGFAGIGFSFSSMIGLEPTVALLLTAFALKLTELAQRKDAYVLLFLGYFIIVTEFLFSQDILVTLLCLFNVIVITTALVALHRPEEHQFSWRPLRLATVMVMQAMPLMLVLFFLFPRIGPLWTIPLKSQSGKTGMSDFMKPGDVSRLSQSTEVAFRVQFEGEVPPRSQLYWRGLIFSRLRAGTWSSLSHYEVPAAERQARPLKTKGEPLRYSIILEPTQQHWLYSLRYARPVSRGVMSGSDYRLFSPVEIEDQRLYEARSWPDTILDETLSPWRRKTELRLPVKGNPATREFARQLRQEAGNDELLVDKVLEHFNREPFVYTLKPPLLPEENPIDYFLFQSRRGFCEHYAHSFVLMMRAAGVPARVVAGYQGGEVNPVNGTVIVHQFDAHAWAEVWLEEQGWVRVDPTSAVSPGRIELGLEEAVASEGTFLLNSPLSPLRYRNINWVNQLRLRYDAWTYRWQAWVTGFDSEQQFRFLQNLLGDLNGRKFALVLLGSWALVLLPVAISLLRKPRRRVISRLDKLYLSFCQRIQKQGVKRSRGESPGEFSIRASQELPLLASHIERITGLYTELAYVDKAASTQEYNNLLDELGRAVRKLPG